MKQLLLCFLGVLCFFLSKCSAQQSKFKLPDDFLISEPQIEVMTLGTWHFAYPNQDSYKVQDKDQIDMASEKKQEEILEVVKQLKKFKPTIICIEASNQKLEDSLFQEYVKGNRKLDIGESEQLGFRLGKELGLSRIHCVDTYSWIRDNYKKYPQLENLWDDEFYLDTLQMIKWQEKYYHSYQYFDSITANSTVKEGLFYANHPQVLERNIGRYLIEMKTSNHNGPDAFALKWYDRNIRIFNNVLKTNPTNQDRILIIFGMSHVALLNDFFEDSPQFKLIRPYEY